MQPPEVLLFLRNQKSQCILGSMPQGKIIAVIDSRTRGLLGRLQTFFSRRNLEAYLVGGFPRDLVVNRVSPDIDVVVKGNSLTVGRELAAELEAKPVVLDADSGVTRLVPLGGGNWQIDLSTMLEGLHADLARRDFTLDAMAIDIAGLDLFGGDTIAEIIDPLGGLQDIGKKLIRATGDDVFRKDGIRLLRAIRLAGELKFKIENQTESTILKDSACLRVEAGERVREEILRILRQTGSDDTLLYMQKLGLLTAVFPELEPSIKLTQHGEHQWDVLEHSLHSVRALDFLLRRDSWPHTDNSILEDVPWNEKLAAHFDKPVNSQSTHRELCKLAAILHDVAKPQTRTISKSGKLRFYGHPQEGALIASEVMERLRFSTREKNIVVTIVANHLRPVQMNQKEPLPSRRAVYRFVRDIGDAVIDTLFFSLADHLATRGDNLDLTNWHYHANIVAHVLRESEREAGILPVRFVDGHDLQRELGMEPGPKLGSVLDELREAYAAGEITSRVEALRHAEEFIKITDRSNS
jgi:poly(A) polymerase